MNEESKRLGNILWFSEIKMILLKTGFGNERINDIIEEIYQVTKKYYKVKENKK